MQVETWGNSCKRGVSYFTSLVAEEIGNLICKIVDIIVLSKDSFIRQSIELCKERNQILSF